MILKWYGLVQMQTTSFEAEALIDWGLPRDLPISAYWGYKDKIPHPAFLHGL